MKINIAEQDIVFLSYDEPNADANYADLLTKVPWAKRIHGVEGSDAAHKACAEIAETENFITVDGDTIIDPNFLNVVLDLDKLEVDDSYQFSWCGHINVNGLKYGNGSLKMWTKDFVKKMRTHENTDGKDDTQIEFCYFDKYYQLNENYSTSLINATPQQAWRAGFREGVKMSLNRGAKVHDIKTETWWQNYNRLLVWMMVGQDLPNGLWTIYGARAGCYKTTCEQWDHTQTRNFLYLNGLWQEDYEPNADRLLEETREVGRKLIDNLGIEISEDPLSGEQSKFFKKAYINTPRTFNKGN